MMAHQRNLFSERSVADGRLINTFGKRESELAALWIMDNGNLDRVFQLPQTVDEMVRDGFDLLRAGGFLICVPGGFIVSQDFKERCSKERRKRARL